MMQLSLLNTKPDSQVFACLVDANQTKPMSGIDIAETRRARLREWFSEGPMPAEEKSYLSQLINGKASFGERAARRLEKTYGMGDGFLDKKIEAVKEESASYSAEKGNTKFANTMVKSKAASLISSASPRSKQNLEKIIQAASDGRLSEEDISLLNTIAERIAKKE